MSRHFEEAFIHCGAGSDIRPEAVELGDNVDLDYFDRQDLGRLRRKIRNAVQGYRRERELYLEIVGQYFQVIRFVWSCLTGDGVCDGSGKSRATFIQHCS